MPDPRFYVVEMKDNSRRLVDANNPAHAMRHIARSIVARCEPVKQRELAELIDKGVKIELASARDAEAA